MDIRSKTIFSTNFLKPIGFTVESPKHPQSISRPRNIEITISRMNNVSKLEMMNEFSLTAIPNINIIPLTTSNHGINTAKKLISISGKSLYAFIDSANAEGELIFWAPAYKKTNPTITLRINNKYLFDKKLFIQCTI